VDIFDESRDDDNYSCPCWDFSSPDVYLDNHESGRRGDKPAVLRFTHLVIPLQGARAQLDMINLSSRATLGGLAKDIHGTERTEVLIWSSGNASHGASHRRRCEMAIENGEILN
jgi:hypothetical protein